MPARERNAYFLWARRRRPSRAERVPAHVFPFCISFTFSFAFVKENVKGNENVQAEQKQSIEKKAYSLQLIIAVCLVTLVILFLVFLYVDYNEKDGPGSAGSSSANSAIERGWYLD